MTAQLKTLTKQDFQNQNCFRMWQERWDKCGCVWGGGSILRGINGNVSFTEIFFNLNIHRIFLSHLIHVKQMFAYPDSVVGFIKTLFFRLTSFTGIPDSVRILYKTVLQLEL